MFCKPNNVSTCHGYLLAYSAPFCHLHFKTFQIEGSTYAKAGKKELDSFKEQERGQYTQS